MSQLSFMKLRPFMVQPKIRTGRMNCAAVIAVSLLKNTKDWVQRCTCHVIRLSLVCKDAGGATI